MLNQVLFFRKLAVLGLSIGIISLSISGAIAADSHSNSSNNSAQETAQFRSIEQPLVNKVAVTLGGLGLIGLELWWFLFSKSKSLKDD
ncbi:hypothetical protein PN499_00120 [Kamptonema animale CS-326]|jgi:plastocyanin domain-containing protein|uniref:hypothetical protein n=1 Tax=Kamptonema animale TaxID=92934 RepID=UPI0023310258|nr:hypothetical protein [Kamptonema animale]MDB9509610.1 hypothetical protein [Kamptonema animale CS-326]